MNKIFLKRSEDLLLEATFRSQSKSFEVDIVRRLTIESAMLALDAGDLAAAQNRIDMLWKLHGVKNPRHSLALANEMKPRPEWRIGSLNRILGTSSSNVNILGDFPNDERVMSKNEFFLKQREEFAAKKCVKS